MKEVNEVIVAVDDTAGSAEAAGAAARLADAMEASLTLLYVFPLSARDLSGVTHIGPEDFATMRDSAARKVFDKMSSALGADAGAEPRDADWRSGGRDNRLSGQPPGRSRGSGAQGSIQNPVIVARQCFGEGGTTYSHAGHRRGLNRRVRSALRSKDISARSSVDWRGPTLHST
jgi:hypothetical protein